MRFFVELSEGLWIAWDAIRANKMRSLLTTLGIIIGVVTVTLMGTVIDGLNRAFLNSIAMLGVDTLYISRTGWFVESYEEWRRLGSRREITLRQSRQIEELLPPTRAVAPVAEARAPVHHGTRRSDSVMIIGSTEKLAITGGFTIAEGRFLSTEEVDGGRPVCVLGSEVATNLFPRGPSLGQRVMVGPQRFEVIGVMAKQGSFLGAFSLDNQVVIPVKQFISTFWHNPDLQIQVKVGDLHDLDDAREELRGVVRRVRRLAPVDPDDFAINQQSQLSERLARVSVTIAGVGLFITGLSLFVGGIGIMNIMFVSVAERTREIGIRKAIGAKRRAILMQFLSEAAAICLLGGMVALAIAWPLTLILKRFMPAQLSWWLVAVALLVSLFTGLIAGLLPAWRAARMDPVDALRQE
jgi:putative ABC transport system permease protein